MNSRSFRHGLMLASFLFLGGLASGCTTVVAPLSDSATVSTDGSHGLLFGHTRLTWFGTGRTEGIQPPQGMRWTLEEETRGKHVVVADLPTDGPFVLKLPAGSYRVKGISFDSLIGIWHAALPTTFHIQPRGCTSLGIWELQRETRFSTGWITGQVLEDLELTQDELQQALAARDCPSLGVLFDASMRSKLAFQNRGSGLNYSD
ncbi:MAG: hypothetical protein H8K03_03020 [Nitrospira sp.]